MTRPEMIARRCFVDELAHAPSRSINLWLISAAPSKGSRYSNSSFAHNLANSPSSSSTYAHILQHRALLGVSNNLSAIISIFAHRHARHRRGISINYCMLQLAYKATAASRLCIRYTLACIRRVRYNLRQGYAANLCRQHRHQIVLAIWTVSLSPTAKNSAYC